MSEVNCWGFLNADGHTNAESLFFSTPSRQEVFDELTVSGLIVLLEFATIAILLVPPLVEERPAVSGLIVHESVVVTATIL